MAPVLKNPWLSGKTIHCTISKPHQNLWDISVILFRQERILRLRNELASGGKLTLEEVKLNHCTGFGCPSLTITYIYIYNLMWLFEIEINEKDWLPLAPFSRKLFETSAFSHLQLTGALVPDRYSPCWGSIWLRTASNTV